MNVEIGTEAIPFLGIFVSYFWYYVFAVHRTAITIFDECTYSKTKRLNQAASQTSIKNIIKTEFLFCQE
jgi:hypothetical protein